MLHILLLYQEQDNRLLITDHYKAQKEHYDKGSAIEGLFKYRGSNKRNNFNCSEQISIILIIEEYHKNIIIVLEN